MLVNDIEGNNLKDKKCCQIKYHKLLCFPNTSNDPNIENITVEALNDHYIYDEYISC